MKNVSSALSVNNKVRYTRNGKTKYGTVKSKRGHRATLDNGDVLTSETEVTAQWRLTKGSRVLLCGINNTIPEEKGIIIEVDEKSGTCIVGVNECYKKDDVDDLFREVELSDCKLILSFENGSEIYI